MKKMAKMMAMAMAIVMIVACMAGCTATAPNGAPKDAPKDTASNTDVTEAKEPEAGEVTAASLLKASSEKAAAAEGVKFDMDMAMEMMLSIFGETENVKMDAKMNIESDQENAHALVNMNVESSSEKEVKDTELYVMKDGEGYVSYVKGEEGWSKNASEAFDADSVNKVIFDDASNFELAEEGNEYVVTGKVSLKDAFEAMPEGTMENMMDSADLEVAGDMLNAAEDVTVVYRFDKETQDLISVKLDMSAAMESAMISALKDSMANADLTAEDIAEAEAAVAEAATEKATEEVAEEPAEEASEEPVEEAVKEPAEAVEKAVEAVEEAADAAEAADGEAADAEVEVGDMSQEDFLAMMLSMIKFEFPKFEITLSNIEYGAVEIVVPEEVLAAAVEAPEMNVEVVEGEEVPADEAEAPADEAEAPVDAEVAGEAVEAEAAA